MQIIRQLFTEETSLLILLVAGRKLVVQSIWRCDSRSSSIANKSAHTPLSLDFFRFSEPAEGDLRQGDPNRTSPE